ncbi:MAG: hypothetical protein LBM66_04315, partial [Bifidobacteriaceae bacterium]|nr:hypothetical protein [Bifidobacteriaceae bacterium]
MKKASPETSQPPVFTLVTLPDGSGPEQLAARLSKTAQSLPGAADAAPYEWIVVAPDAGGSGRAGT